MKGLGKEVQYDGHMQSDGVCVVTHPWSYVRFIVACDAY